MRIEFYFSQDLDEPGLVYYKQDDVVDWNVFIPSPNRWNSFLQHVAVCEAVLNSAGAFTILEIV